MGKSSDKLYLVTGASSGIGKVITTSLLEQGAYVIATGRNLEELDQLKERYPDNQLVNRTLDYSETNYDDIVQNIEKLDGFVDAAGISPLLPAKLTDYNTLYMNMQINFMGPATLINLLLKKRKFKKNSSIVLLSSISGCGISNIGLSNYAASKAALIGYMKSLALEIAPDVRINTIAPGMVDTGRGMFSDTMQRMSEEDINMDLALYSMKRFGTPVDVSNLVCFLLKDDASWITGQNFIIDGGRTLK